MNTAQQRRALDQFIPAQRENPTFRQTTALMLGPTDALQQCSYRARRAQLANKINRTNVNSQFERRRSDEGFQFAALQPIFGFEPQFCGKTSVMGRDSISAHQLAEMMCDALGHATRVDKN